MVPLASFVNLGRVLRGVLLSTLLTCPGIVARAAEHWIVGRTEHFEMYSSASEADSRHMLVSLEQFRANFLALFPLRGASEPRTTVVLFGSDSAFRAYKPLYEGKPKDVAGYFIPGTDEVAIALSSDTPDRESDPAEVIYHEYVHLLLDVRDAHYPLWLEEGLAEVFSTFSIDKGKVEYGLAKDRHVALLQHSSLLPLDKLFAVTHESPDYNEDGRMGIFYAESWAFTHYLVCGENKANASRLNLFMQRLAQGAPIEASFREAFGTDYRVQEDALRRYLDGGGYYKRRVPAVGHEVKVTFRPATDLERDFALLNLRWRVHHNADAAGRALALLGKDPNQPRPHELLAAIAADAGDSNGAREHWQRAAELNSDNPWIYVQLLRDQLSAYDGPMMLDVRLPNERILPLRAWANRALTLSPENADAIELAITIEALAAKMDVRVINAVQRRVDTIRKPARALLALGIVHWRGQDFKGARTLVNLVLSDAHAEMSTRSAATALRYKMPADPEAAEEVVTGDALTELAKKHGIALDIGHSGAAATYLDGLLAERGTTAPRAKLEPVVVHPAPANQPDAWQRADEQREKARAGDPNAMFDLAVAHACGSGVEFSPSLAREWFQKAVEHGHRLAAAGAAPDKLDPELAAQFLRSQVATSATGALPPLEQELKTRVADAAMSAARQPFAILYRSAPRYPETLQRAGKDGEALVRFQIRPDGHPDAVQAAQFSDSASAAAAEQCIRGWRFLPTIRDHQPVTTYVEVQVTFRADKLAPKS